MGKYFPTPEYLGGNVYTSMFPKKVDLASLKSEMNNLGIGKLETTLNNLSKLSNVVKNEVVKKTEDDEFIKKVNVIKTTHTSNLVKKLAMTQKLVHLKRKLLIMTIAISRLLHNNLIIAEKFAARLRQADLANKADIDNFIKRQILMINSKT